MSSLNLLALSYFHKYSHNKHVNNLSNDSNFFSRWVVRCFVVKLDGEMRSLRDWICLLLILGSMYGVSPSFLLFSPSCHFLGTSTFLLLKYIQKL
uniref:Ovule protein n=1 Tax=Heterorhabditis bacteriophora TaxID=37862 RepID=A0A1I7WTS1_HETBA